MADLTRIETLKAFLADDEEDTFVIFALAKEYEKQGILKMALDTYHRLEQIDPDYVGLYYHLGKLQEVLSEPESAVLTYEKGIQVAKKIGDFHALSELHTAKINLEVEL